MPKFAANLHYLFTEFPFMERFDAAARAGFKGVEFQVPYDFPAAELGTRLRSNGLQMVLFDAPMGNWEKGDRGLAAVPGREKEFRDSLPRIAEYADALDCHTVHVMAGVVSRDAYQQAQQVYLENLRYAADYLASLGVTAVIEPINSKLGDVRGGPDYTTQGMHGYFLNHTTQARHVIEVLNATNLLLHLDCYHMQMLEGNLAETIRRNIALTRHFQIAGVPGRHEPDVGEINYPFLFDLIDALGYDGWIGCEYRPKGETVSGLKWAASYGIG